MQVVRVPLYHRLILITGPPDGIEAAAKAHLEQIDLLRAQWKLRGAGRFRRDEGFFEVFEARDLHEAEDLAREDPLIAAGLGSWILRSLDHYE
jgi:uncharacterized protein YciI